MMDDKYEVTANYMKDKEKFLSTGCATLNASLRGGISCLGITQIYGAAATGKTQFALQLCLTVQLPVEDGGLAAGAVYICTESAFPIRRLNQLLQKSVLAKEHNISGDVIYIEHISTIDDLETCLIHRIPVLMKAHRIGLIVIDSIAAPYRVEDWNDEARTRAKSLRTVGQQLHNICRNGDVCIVCINQVSAVIERTELSDGMMEQPALGITWSSMITNTLYFHRKDNIKYISVTISPHLPRTTHVFEVLETGVRGQ